MSNRIAIIEGSRWELFRRGWRHPIAVHRRNYDLRVINQRLDTWTYFLPFAIPTVVLLLIHFVFPDFSKSINDSAIIAVIASAVTPFLPSNEVTYNAHTKLFHLGRFKSFDAEDVQAIALRKDKKGRLGLYLILENETIRFFRGTTKSNLIYIGKLLSAETGIEFNALPTSSD